MCFHGAGDAKQWVMAKMSQQFLKIISDFDKLLQIIYGKTVQHNNPANPKIPRFRIGTLK